MRVGIHLPHIGRKAGPEAIRRAAIQAEERDFADAWSSEHIIIPKGASYPPSALLCFRTEAAPTPKVAQVVERAN